MDSKVGATTNCHVILNRYCSSWFNLKGFNYLLCGLSFLKRLNVSHQLWDHWQYYNNFYSQSSVVMAVMYINPECEDMMWTLKLLTDATLKRLCVFTSTLKDVFLCDLSLLTKLSTLGSVTTMRLCLYLQQLHNLINTYWISTPTHTLWLIHRHPLWPQLLKLVFLIFNGMKGRGNRKRNISEVSCFPVPPSFPLSVTQAVSVNLLPSPSTLWFPQRR